MKADNKPAISLPAYFKSVKNGNMFYEKTKKQKDQKKKKGREPDVEGQRVICCATTTNSEGAR